MTSIELEAMGTYPDCDGGITVGDAFSFAPDYDYGTEIAEQTRYLSALVSGQAHVEMARTVADELRVVEASEYLQDAWNSYTNFDGGTTDDVFRFMARKLLSAVDGGLV